MITAAAVVGPTASGKTAFAIELAEHLNGEIISCDSMQIYKGIPIGTAKPSEAELARVKHHLIDFLEIDQTFSVSDYVDVAENKMKSVFESGKLPIIAGGTGLYARSLLSGLSFEEECRSEEVRQKLLKDLEINGAEALYKRLQELDLAAAQNIHPNNTKRVIRALEFCLVTGRTFSGQIEASKPLYPKYNYLMLCLTYRNRECLYERINRRVDLMLQNGLLQEAKELYTKIQLGQASSTVLQAIGYKELFPYFEGKITLEEAIERIKQGTRRYAKRQLTWFRKEQNIEFLYMDELDSKEAVEKAMVLLAEKGIGKVK